MATLDYQALFYEDATDPAASDFRGPCVFLAWHEYIPFLFYLRPHCRISLLLSRHTDAEWLAQAAELHGFGTVRGSTARGGVQALRGLIRTARGWNLAITPDGPRGPRRKLAPGCIALAAHARIPLIPVGVGYDRPWRVRRSWDQFAVPRPRSRARAVVGPRIMIPELNGRDDIERHRLAVERALLQVTGVAEEWAASGSRPVDRFCTERTTLHAPPVAALRVG